MNINLEDGKYIIKVAALHKDRDEASAMANYLADVAIVTKDESSLSITFMLMDNEVVTGFQLGAGHDEKIFAKENQINSDANSRYELFELDELPVILEAYVQYEIDHEGRVIKGDEMLRLKLDVESLEATE